MEKKTNYIVAICIIVVCITGVQLSLFIKEEQYFAVLSVFLFILMICSYLMTTRSSSSIISQYNIGSNKSNNQVEEVQIAIPVNEK